MAYNPYIHHRKSTRLEGYDYSQAGLYFVTICCHDRMHFFGNEENKKMILNEIETIANEYWKEIPKHFPNAVLHEHIVMPNHVHGIIELANDAVGKRHGVSLQQFGKPIPGSLSVIVNQYKSSVKRWCNKNGHEYFKR